jgi:RNA polymerase sigma factor (sigma-70 family)
MESQTLTQPLEHELLGRAKSGDFAAFQRLIVQLQPRVYGLAFRILQQSQDAEDATQQTFLAMIEHLGDFREQSSLSTWALRIVSNNALKILRKKRGLHIRLDVRNRARATAMENCPILSTSLRGLERLTKSRRTRK